MKHWYRLLVVVLLGLTLAVAQTSPKAQKQSRGSKKQVTAKADLQKGAKFTKEEASLAALAKVPNGAIKEGELEKEKGRLVWSFDITSPDTKDISEVQVDAKTGEVVSVTKESPAAEAEERKAEATKKEVKKQ